MTKEDYHRRVRDKIYATLRECGPSTAAELANDLGTYCRGYLTPIAIARYLEELIVAGTVSVIGISNNVKVYEAVTA